MTAGFNISYLMLFFFLMLSIMGCGSYEGKIIGKWKAVENQCDTRGTCKNRDDVSGFFEYTKDGKMIIDDRIQGTYKIKKNIVNFELKSNDILLKGIAEIYYIKGNELLAKYRFKKSDGEKDAVGEDLGDTDIIKYHRAEQKQ